MKERDETVPEVQRPEFDCVTCGACCAYSREWPRFSLETEEELARIPPALIDDSQSRMRCSGDRCDALSGEIGKQVACTIYDIRPHVCRECQPEDPECLTARGLHRIWS